MSQTILQAGERNELLSARILEMEKEELRLSADLQTQESLLQADYRDLRIAAAGKIYSLKKKLQEIQASVAVSRNMITTSDNGN